MKILIVSPLAQVGNAFLLTDYNTQSKGNQRGNDAGDTEISKFVETFR